MNCTLFKRHKVIRIFTYSLVFEHSLTFTFTFTTKQFSRRKKWHTESSSGKWQERNTTTKMCPERNIRGPVCLSVRLLLPVLSSVRPSEHPLDLFGLYCSSKCRIVPFVRLRLLAEQNEWGR